MANARDRTSSTPADVPDATKPSEAFLAAFVERAGNSGILRFDEFVDVALFDRRCGYYYQSRPRVGYGPGTDFFTASTSGPIFGELIAASCANLLTPATAGDYTFVEIGAETEGGVLHGIEHPFQAARTIPLGTELEIAGNCVVFSNELFDAQPFRRFRFTGDAWRELGVALDGDRLRETELAGAIEPAVQLILPPVAAEGYLIDAPIAAARLIEIIARQPWSGLFVAIDYGKTWRELTEACPAGTARAYYRHRQTNDLLARPGDQDLTCHVCWDWLEDALARHDFTETAVATQESFLMRHAAGYIERAIAADAAKLTARKQSLMQLLHGAHLGQKFQALSAVRRRQ